MRRYVGLALIVVGLMMLFYSNASLSILSLAVTGSFTVNGYPLDPPKKIPIREVTLDTYILKISGASHSRQTLWQVAVFRRYYEYEGRTYTLLGPYAYGWLKMESVEEGKYVDLIDLSKFPKFRGQTKFLVWLQVRGSGGYYTVGRLIVITPPVGSPLEETVQTDEVVVETEAPEDVETLNWEGGDKIVALPEPDEVEEPPDETVAIEVSEPEQGSYVNVNEMTVYDAAVDSLAGSAIPIILIIVGAVLVFKKA